MKDRGREAAGRVFAIPPRTFHGNPQSHVDPAAQRPIAAMIITYAQGMAQLRRASEAYGYHLNLEDVARIWHGGCIILRRCSRGR